jgi:tetratricopeptide (TPR) repeat protein
LEAILAINPNLAIAHGRLGTAYLALNEKEKGLEQLNMVSQLDPDEPDGESMLGWMCLLDGKFEDALEHLKKTDAMEPLNSTIKYRCGLAYLNLRQWNNAEQAFLLSKAIDPNDFRIYQGLSSAMIGQQKFEEAIDYALQAAKLTRFQNAAMILSLADAYAEAGRVADAISATTQALELAYRNNSHMVAQINARLDDLRKRAASLPNTPAR